MDMHICALAPGMISEKKKLRRSLSKAIELSESLGVRLAGGPLSEELKLLRQSIDDSIARNLEKR